MAEVSLTTAWLVADHHQPARFMIVYHITSVSTNQALWLVKRVFHVALFALQIRISLNSNIEEESIKLKLCRTFYV